MNIALIGYRGTGKTSVGELLAARLACSFVDADVALVERDGRTIQQIFEDDGEAFFRDLERVVLRELVTRDNTVLSLGGGVILREENRELLKSCTTLWLTATAETIAGRLAGDPHTQQQRPNLTSAGGLDEIRAMLETRTPLYESCADFTINTDDRTPQSIVDEIISIVDVSNK